MSYLDKLIDKITNSEKDGEFKMADYKATVIERNTHFTVHLYRGSYHFADWTFDKDFKKSRIEIYRGIPEMVEKILKRAILEAGYPDNFEVTVF